MEGSGQPGSNALTITKSLTLAGTGAGQVTIKPRDNGGQIAEDSPDIRDGKGDLIAVTGTSGSPVTVHISGVTVDAAGVYTTAVVVFVDAQGSIDHSHVTGLDTDESANGYQVPGGFRSNQFGYGIAQVSTAPACSGSLTRRERSFPRPYPVSRYPDERRNWRPRPPAWRWRPPVRFVPTANRRVMFTGIQPRSSAA